MGDNKVDNRGNNVGDNTEINPTQILMVLLRLDEAMNKLNARLGEIEKKIEAAGQSSKSNFTREPRGEDSERRPNRFSGQARGRDFERKDRDSGRPSRFGGSDRKEGRYSKDDREKGSFENGERKPYPSRSYGDKEKSSFSHDRKDSRGFRGKGGSGDGYKPRKKQ